MEFFSQEYCSRLPFLSLGGLPDPGIKSESPALTGRFFTTELPAAAKSLQSCLTLCDHIDGSPAGSSVHGIFQARVLEWITIAYSGATQEAPKLTSTFAKCIHWKILIDLLLIVILKL